MRAYPSQIHSVTETDLSQIVMRSQNGDTEAFHLLFARYSRPILTFIHDLLGDRNLAEELTQETFVRAYKSLRGLKDPAKFSSWLFSIAKNIAREAIRERCTHPRKVSLDEPDLQLEDDQPTPDARLINNEIQEAIQQALWELPEDWRTVFILKIFHQRSYEEMVEITGWSLGKVKTDLHRARAEMRRRLAEHLK